MAGMDFKDPMTLALFLSPIAELLKPGAGAGLYAGAIQGMSRREALAAEIKEKAEARKERLLEKDEDRAFRQGEYDRRDAERKVDNRRQAIAQAIQNPEAIPFLRGLPEYEGIDFSGIPMPEKKPTAEDKAAQKDAGKKVELERKDAAATQAGKRTRRRDLHAELRNILRDAHEGMEGRIHQIAPVLGVDANTYVKAYQKRVNERKTKEGASVKLTEARTVRTKQLAEKGARQPVGRRSAAPAPTSKTPNPDRGRRIAGLPAADKVVSKERVQAYARQNGVSYEEAAKKARADGYSIK